MYCFQCGKEISDESKFCPYCGTKLEQEKPQPVSDNQAEPQPVLEQPQWEQPKREKQKIDRQKAEKKYEVPSRKNWKDILMLLGTLAMAALFVICVYLFNEGEDWVAFRDYTDLSMSRMIMHLLKNLGLGYLLVSCISAYCLRGKKSRIMLLCNLVCAAALFILELWDSSFYVAVEEMRFFYFPMVAVEPVILGIYLFRKPVVVPEGKQLKRVKLARWLLLLPVLAMLFTVGENL